MKNNILVTLLLSVFIALLGIGMDLFGIEWAFYICGAAVMLITLAAARMIFVGEKEMAAAQPR